jgi:hypothetical protein
MLNTRVQARPPLTSLATLADRRFPVTASLTAQAIIRAVATEFDLGVDAMMHRRVLPESRARQVAMFLVRDELRMSYPQIGRLFRRDHTTVLQATRKVGQLLLTDKGFALRIDSLRTRLSGSSEAVCCPSCGQSLGSAAYRRAVVEQLKQQMQELADRIAVLEATTP